MTVKIYVASLEAYNQGRMIGGWITPSEYEDFDKFRWAIQDATKHADEVAVHDFEGISLDTEYPDFEKLFNFVQAMEDSHLDNEAIIAYAENCYSDYEDYMVDEAEDNYLGTYDSFQEYADEYADEMLNVRDNDFLMNYFDYDSFARDLEYDYTVLDIPNYQVAIFTNG